MDIEARLEINAPRTAISEPAGNPARRRMKGRQVLTALYLPPMIYRELKQASRRDGVPMQRLLRDAVREYLSRREASALH